MCLDLVGYSKRSVAQQGEIKEAFNALLMQVLKRVPPEDRIILDTGDGAAISFLGDPEQSLGIGLALRDAMNGATAKLGGSAADAGAVRIGINLGPVKLGVDMNGHPKIIGDGINVAEKICEFASPGQVLVSRPFHDVVSRMSPRHAQIFHYEGVRTDRNVREHEVYSVQAAAPAAPPMLSRPAQPEAVDLPADESFLVAFLRDRTKVSIAAAVLIAIIAGEIVLAVHRMEGAAPPAPAATKEPVAKAPPPVVPKAEPAKPAEKKSEPAKAEPKKVEPPKPEAKPPEPPKPEPKKAEPPKPELPKVEAAKAPEPRKPEPTKPAESKKPDSPRITIPSPRTPPGQVAPAPAPAPAIQPTEPVQAIREPPKAAPPDTAAQAIPVSRIPATFPLAAVNRGISAGTVRARLKINAAGNVTDVVILASEPPRIFDRAATTALESWRFNTGADNRTYDVEMEFKR